MSTQSIKQIARADVLESIDQFLICEGRAFSNIIDYDLKMKVDYDKIRKILYLREMAKRSHECEKINLIIDKLLK